MTLRSFPKKKEHVLRAVESACDDNSQSVEAWDPEFSLQSEASETLSQNEQISMWENRCVWPDLNNTEYSIHVWTHERVLHEYIQLCFYES